MPRPPMSELDALSSVDAVELVKQALQQHLLAIDDMFEMRHSKLQEGLEEKLDTIQHKLTEELHKHAQSSFMTRVHASDSFAYEEKEEEALLPLDGSNEEEPEEESGPTTRRGKSLSKMFTSEDYVGPPPGTMRGRVYDVIHHSRWFDVVIAKVVLANICVMFVQLEYEGYKKALSLGLESDDTKWVNAQDYFDMLEYFFSGVFTIELALRFFADGLQVLKHVTNIIDIVIVLLSCIDLYIMKLAMSNKDGANMNFARIARIFKVFKMLRAFRAATSFSELRILSKTVVSSMMALFWSAVLLSFVILCSGLFMAQMVQGCIEDSTQDLDLRIWAFKLYGSGMRASYTMFEATLSGGWPNYARRLVEEVSVGFAAFWLCYVLIVIFAVIRIITALFLKNTIKVSQSDEDMMIMERMKEKEAYVKKIRQFLVRADTDGNGFMDRDELEDAVRNPEMTKYFRAVGLQLHEIDGLFNILDDGDGMISSEEFVGGCMRLTGNARAVDSVLIMHEQQTIEKKVDAILKDLATITPKTHKVGSQLKGGRSADKTAEAAASKVSAQ